MNGAQDLGGKHGHGPVIIEKNEPWFHYEWERRVFAMTIAMGFCGEWNIDASRFARENQNPADYANSSYYQIWLFGLLSLLKTHGLITPQEMQTGIVETIKPTRLSPNKADVEAGIATQGNYIRQVKNKPKFAIGDDITAKIMNPKHHTRIPAYVRGKKGVITANYGAHVLPDSNSQFKGEAPQYLYNVCFDANDLWQENAEPNSNIYLDLWESYLD